MLHFSHPTKIELTAAALNTIAIRTKAMSVGLEPSVAQGLVNGAARVRRAADMVLCGAVSDARAVLVRDFLATARAYRGARRVSGPKGGESLMHQYDMLFAAVRTVRRLPRGV